MEDTLVPARVARDAVHLTRLSAVVHGAKLDTVRRNVMDAAKMGFTSQLLRVAPLDSKGKMSAHMQAVQELKDPSSGFEVRCVSVDAGPARTHSYLVRWGSITALPGARAASRVGVPAAVERSAPDGLAEMTDAELFSAASEASRLIGESAAALREVKKGNPVRNAVLSASRQGYSCTLQRVEPESDNEKTVQALAAAGLNVVLVSVDAELRKAHSYLVYWGSHWGTAPAGADEDADEDAESAGEEGAEEESADEGAESADEGAESADGDADVF